MSTLNNTFIESIQESTMVKVRTVIGQTYKGILLKFDQDNNILVLECKNSNTRKVVSLFLDHIVVIE